MLAQIQPRNVLEIGVGQGSVGVLLARRYDYTGIDLDETALDTARDRFRRGGVDADRLLLGGLEQVEERGVRSGLRVRGARASRGRRCRAHRWHAHVAPGGWLALSVPADPRRFGDADEKAGHYRRYTRENLSRVLTAAGFANVRLLNYGFPIGYLLEAGRNMYARRHTQTASSYEERTLASGRWLQPPESAGQVMAIVSWPLGHLQRPFAGRELGTGLVALAERPAQA